ncbi:SH3 domain protein [Thalassotalea marina]|uniref:SH3 domain protein n=1 Tax=Thalassotalea marina TaxID=1673741 RepID=A0A919BG14_9GAMM|nr:SH3 domain protein [Thalassotalea marina]
MCSLLSAPVVLAAQSTDESNANIGYITDDLFIYMHAGPGSHYRLVGSINAGDEISLTGKTENDYTEIIDTKERTAWVESKYVSVEPGLRQVIASLNAQLAVQSEDYQQASSQLTDNNQLITSLQSREAELSSQIENLNKQLDTLRGQLDNQDLEIKKEYFFNGAIVLVVGLILGIVLPRISVKKRSSMDNWK